LLLAQLTGGEGRVYAFEPEPNLHAVLRDNCMANGAKNVVPFQCAAGNFNGRARFRRSTFNSGNNSLAEDSAGVVEVKVAKLDDVVPVRQSTS
jgi:FkbM family methyltransferase